jgi:hypothetical protein
MAFPFTKDHPDIDADADEDWWLDDGNLEGLVSIEEGGELLRLHSVELKDPALARKRTGAGRRSMEALRPLFRTIVADGAIHPFAGSPEDEAPMLFWTAMLRDGLIDEMYLANSGTRFTPEDLGRPVETDLGLTVTLGRDGTFSCEPPAPSPGR